MGCFVMDDKKTWPTVCAAVVAYKRPDELDRLLRSLDEQTHMADALLVIDNSVDDDPVADNRRVFERYAARYAAAEFCANTVNVGSAGGFAAAMRRAAGDAYDFVWLLDQDGVADNGCLARLLDAAAQCGGCRRPVLCPVVRAIDDGYVLPDFRCGVGLLGAVAPVADVRGDAPMPIRFAGTHGILASRDAIDLVGVYDDSLYFVGGEDFDWTERAASAGLAVLLVPDAVVRHPDLSKKRAMSSSARVLRGLHHKIGLLAPQFLGYAKGADDKMIMLGFHRRRLNALQYILAVAWSAPIAAVLKLTGVAQVDIGRTISAYLTSR